MKDWEPGLRYRLWLHLLNHLPFRSIKEHWGSRKTWMYGDINLSLTLGKLLTSLGLHFPNWEWQALSRSFNLRFEDSFRQGIGKLWLMSQIWSIFCFYKFSFIDTQPGLFIYILTMTALMLKWQSGVVVRETVLWVTKPKIFTSLPLLIGLLTPILDQPLGNESNGLFQ